MGHRRSLPRATLLRVKLGEALSQRSDIQKRIAQLGGRLQASSMVQEGDSPPENPAELLDELQKLTAELEALIAAINLTNSSSRLPSGVSVTEALARRDVIAIKQNVLRATADSMAQTQARYSRSEIRVTRQIDVAAIRRELDDLAKQRRELDTSIQENNWTTELIEDASR